MLRLCWNRIRRWSAALAGIAAILLLLAWLMGMFHTPPPGGPGFVTRKAPAGAAVHTVRMTEQPQFEAAVGTVRPVLETQVSSRVLARIETMHATRAGQPVRAGDLLVELEDEDLQAALAQAKAALQAAESTAARADADLRRTRELFQSGVAAQDRLDRDVAALRGAEAEVRRAQQIVAAAETALSFATIRAPIDGIVIDKHANTGDLAQPGQVLVTLYDPTRLQLIAVVREELALRLRVGSEVDVEIAAIDKSCVGTVDQIVPQAETRTRSFEVKVVGPCAPGVMSGMFGRLRVPVGTRREIWIPAPAVRSVGQLDFVTAVLPDGALQRRLIRTGRRGVDQQIEVLAGLAPGESILADAGAGEPR